MCLQRAMHKMTDQKKIVCVVDDDPDIRRSLERLLGLHGYRPHSFASTTEFLKSVYSREAVCLILDIHLKGESGIDFKRELSYSLPALPVIFITGGDNFANRNAVQQVGGAAYLPKPFGSKALLDALEAATRPRNGSAVLQNV